MPQYWRQSTPWLRCISGSTRTICCDFFGRQDVERTTRENGASRGRLERGIDPGGLQLDVSKQPLELGQVTAVVQVVDRKRVTQPVRMDVAFGPAVAM